MITIINMMFIISSSGSGGMSLKARHNEKVRARILSAAGRSFRRDGFERAKLDDVMRAAGLTRGAFYAHFPSKSVLLPAVLQNDDLLLLLLRNRSTASPDALALGLRYVFRALLDPAHAKLVVAGWNLPSLMRDARMGGDAAREAYETAVQTTLAEMARGQRVDSDHPALSAALALACGAIAMHAACGGTRTGDHLLRASSGIVSSLLDEAIRDIPTAPPSKQTGRRKTGISESAAKIAASRRTGRDGPVAP